MALVASPKRRDAKARTSERIDVRLRPELKLEIEKAAHIKGLTVTDFIIQNALENARRTIRDYETWTLEIPDAEIFAAALMAPAKPGPQLTQAAKRYKEQFLRR